MKKENKVQYATISAILLFVAAVFLLPTVFRQISAITGGHATSSTPFWLLASLVQIGGEVWLGLSLMKQKRGKSVVLGVAIVAAAVLARLILGFASHRYVIYSYSSRGGEAYTFSLWLLLPYLAEFVGYGLLLVFAHFLLNTEDETKQAQAKKLWFLPFALVIAKLPLGVLALFFAHTSIDIIANGMTGFLRFLLEAAAVLEVMLWLAFPEGRETTASEYHGDGYKGMIPHLLLCVVTLGIYQLIWICKVTKYLNARIDSEPAMIPWHQVVASLFVPFYMVYWTYKCAQRLDVAARARGARSNLTMLCTILQIFSFGNVILPSILMQEKINTLALLENGEVAPNAPSMQNGPTWGEAAAPAAAVHTAPAVDNPDELPEI